jgi:hypothetical protein
MRKVLPERIEKGRILTGPHASDPTWGPYGKFFIRCPHCGIRLQIIASGADDPEACGWEHVSVSTTQRCPMWDEMCFVKGLFWEEEELVVQFHPPQADYINNHAYCLHLWRPVDGHIRLPPGELIGIKGVISPAGSAGAFL